MPVQFKNECVHVCMMCVYVDTHAIVHAWKSEDICVESVFFFRLYMSSRD